MKTMNSNHIPVPADHAPRKQTLLQGKHLFVEERDNQEEAWMSMDTRYTMEITR